MRQHFAVLRQLCGQGACSHWARRRYALLRPVKSRNSDEYHPFILLLGGHRLHRRLYIVNCQWLMLCGTAAQRQLCGQQMVVTENGNFCFSVRMALQVSTLLLCVGCQRNR